VVFALNLLSENDFKTIRSAMMRCEEINLLRTLGDISVLAKTCFADDPWSVPMILQIQMKKGKYKCIQNFERVEDAQPQLDEWDRFCQRF